MPLKDFRDLETWQIAMRLARRSYSITATYPKSEVYGLISQIRRAAVSIPANVAEGYGRKHRGDYLRFLSIASGSLAELETLFELSNQLGYAESDEELLDLLDHTSRLLTNLRKSLGVAEETTSDEYN